MTVPTASNARAENAFNPVPELAKASSGIGLRAPHFEAVLTRKPAVGFFEAHSENFFCPGSVPDFYLQKIRADYPVSLHSVGLSLGSAQGIDPIHLEQLAALVSRTEPVLVSDHLSWSAVGARAVPDLLPAPLTEESLHIFACNITRVQEALERPLLVENPSLYTSFDGNAFSEPEFLTELCRKTGCGLLLDINNIHVSTSNTGGDAKAYLRAIPRDCVGEIHLAGYQCNRVNGRDVLVDAHNNPVYDEVWDLYTLALELLGDRPTLIEWDNDLPDLDTLAAEAAKADTRRAKAREKNRAAA